MRTMLIQFGFLQLLLPIRSQGNKVDKWDSSWPSNVKSKTVVPTSVQRPASATTFWIKLLHPTGWLCCELTEGRMRRGGRCVHIIDVWCSKRVKVDEQC